MNDSVTAVVLSAKPYMVPFEGLSVLLHGSIITNAAELQAARFAAILDVHTPFFFFLDDDDALPGDFQEVLDDCIAAGRPLAYTDELIRLPDGSEFVRQSAPYSQAAHLADRLLVHHLVLCRTREAQLAVAQLPRGHYCPEFMLYWQMAKGGAAYVPRVGYVWNKGHGMHTWPETTLSQMRAALWAKANP